MPSVFSVSILFCQGSSGVEDDVDPPGLLGDAVNVFVHGVVVKSVYRCLVRTAAFRRVLLGHYFHVRLGPAGEKYFRAFSRDLPGDRGTDIETAAPNVRANYPCRIGELRITEPPFGLLNFDSHVPTESLTLSHQRACPQAHDLRVLPGER